MSGAWFVQRLLQLVPTVLAVVSVGFVLLHVAPGDPVLALAGADGGAAYYDRLHARFALDRPLPVQFLAYLRNTLTGDLGTSFVHGRPVTALILERLPATLLLGAGALVVSSVVGVVLGVTAAARPGSLLDRVIGNASLTLHAMPVFWLGQLTIVLVAYRLDLLPIQGMTTPGGRETGTAHVADVARHALLPVLVLASQELAAVVRVTRERMLDELRQPYLTAARARGFTERHLRWRHALRGSALPVTTVIGSRVGYLLGGAVVVEVVFGWPGVGRLLLSSMQARDVPVVLGLFLMVAAATVLANLLTDLTYGWLDPRVRDAGAAG